MHRFIAALLLSFFCATSAQAACNQQEEEHLLSAVFYREAVATREAHASVMSSILTRLNSGKHGSTICAVITEPGQYVHKLPPKPEVPKLNLARESAHIFRNEYHSQGYISTKAEVFERLKGLDSFYQARAQMPKGRKGKRVHLSRGLTVGDNTFYKSGH